jgi:uncharacterized protein (UPF0332 family)
MTSPATVAGYMQKAKRALDEARLLLGAQKAEGACSRAYYAMHDAAHAALFATGRETPAALIKTHHSLIAVFGKELVLGGLIDAGFGRAFNRVQDMRKLADYSDEPPPLAEAQAAVEQAEAFIAAISAMLARLEA